MGKREAYYKAAPPTIPPPTDDINRWYFDKNGSGNEFIPYDDETNAFLNEKFREGKKTCALAKGDQKTELVRKVVSFVTMHQFDFKENTCRLVTCSSALYTKNPPLLEFEAMETCEGNYGLLSVGEDACTSVTNHLKTSLPDIKVFRIQYIENKRLKRAWEFERKQVRKKNGKRDLEYTKMLFHGTRRTPPRMICNSPEGLSVHHAKNPGMWGLGTYFSEKASYSHGYAYWPTVEDLDSTFDDESRLAAREKKARQMLLCEVIVGDSRYALPCKDIRMPPLKEYNPLGFAEIHYDSVWGISQATKIHIVYESSRAIPRYLITYKIE